MAWKYPFLYTSEQKNENLIRHCVEASLFTNYFLHFAGSWYESDMWKSRNWLVDDKQFRLFHEYQSMPVTAAPAGLIKPLP
jgi:hypothetical protein